MTVTVRRGGGGRRAKRGAAVLLAVALVVGVTRVDWIALAYEPSFTEVSFADDHPELPLAFDLVLRKRRSWTPGPDHWRRPITRREFVHLSVHRFGSHVPGPMRDHPGRSTHLMFDLKGPDIPGYGSSPDALEATLDRFAARE